MFGPIVSISQVPTGVIWSLQLTADFSVSSEILKHNEYLFCFCLLMILKLDLCNIEIYKLRFLFSSKM